MKRHTTIIFAASACVVGSIAVLALNWAYLSACSIASNLPMTSPGFVAHRNTFEHLISRKQLVSLFAKTLAATDQPPRIFAIEDQISYPILLAVWQSPSAYRSVSIYEANDNLGIVWRAGNGLYTPREDWKYTELKPGEDWRRQLPFPVP